MRKVLFVCGLDDTNTVIVQSIKPDDTRIVVQGTQDISKQVSVPGFQNMSVTLGGVNPTSFNIARPNIIFNCICNPDLNKRALGLAEDLIKNAVVPVINHPEDIRITSRDEIFNRLHGHESLVMPRTTRFKPSRLSDIEAAINAGDIELPFIMRPIGGHGGQGMVLINHTDDLYKLEQFAFDGSDFYIIEYIDYQDKDGLFRKYRFMLIDGKPYIRHLIISDRWNIHTNSRNHVMHGNQVLVEEERKFINDFTDNPPEWMSKAFAAIHNTIKLDYFGIDCCIRPGNRIQIFEVNACMNTLFQYGLKDFPYLEQSLDAIKKALARMIEERAG